MSAAKVQHYNRVLNVQTKVRCTRNEFGTIPMVYWGMVSRTTLTALNIGEVALNSTSLSVVPIYRAPENLWFSGRAETTSAKMTT